MAESEDSVEIRFQSSDDSTQTRTVPVENIHPKENWVVIKTEKRSTTGVWGPQAGGTVEDGDDESDNDRVIFRIPRERIYYLRQEIEEKEEGQSSESDRSGIELI